MVICIHMPDKGVQRAQGQNICMAHRDISLFLVDKKCSAFPTRMAPTFFFMGVPPVAKHNETTTHPPNQQPPRVWVAPLTRGSKTLANSVKSERLSPQSMIQWLQK